ncbi:MAG: hypothetical protein GY847_24730 [Proteobacteria bacterium]|nr:hypothetical protein [Pseudomonadota bacterium]
MDSPVRFGRKVSEVAEGVLRETDVTELVRRRLFDDESAEMGRPPRGSVVRYAVAAGVLVIMASVVVMTIDRRDKAADAVIQSTGKTLSTSAYIGTDQWSTEQVIFPEGSKIDLLEDTGARIVEMTPRVRTVQIEHGSARMDVKHQQDVLWVVRAGPYSVEVTGTAFDIGWAPKKGELHLTMRKGHVRVRGPGVEEPMTVVAGNVLTAWSSNARIELVGNAKGKFQTGAGEETPPKNVKPAREVPEIEPVVDSRHGTFPKRNTDKSKETVRKKSAITKKEQNADSSLLTCAQLWKQSNELRFAGDHDEAQKSFGQLRDSCPGTPKAVMASLILGRMAFDIAKDYTVAEMWFDTYLAESHGNGPIREVRGRLLECSVRLNRNKRATEEAIKYLAQYPDGPHAAIAKDVLAEVDDD